MSYTETHIGKLKPIEIDTDIETWCKIKCQELSGITELEKDKYYDSWRECFQYGVLVPHKYYVTENQVYEILEHHKDDSSNDINFFHPDPVTGEILFVYQFYNGGTCFEEIMDENLDKLENEPK